MKFSLSILLIFVFIQALNAQKCSFNQNFDIVGENFGNKIASSTLDQCCNYCGINPQCQAWTFYKGQCQLKYKVPTGEQAYAKLCINGLYSGRRPGFFDYYFFDNYFTIVPTAVTVSTQFPSFGTLSSSKITASTLPTLFPTTSTLGTSTTTTAKVSACSVEIGINYPQTDIDVKTNVASASDCCNLCGLNASCAGFAYSVSTKACYLKGSGFNTGRREPYPDIISGIVVIR